MRVRCSSASLACALSCFFYALLWISPIAAISTYPAVQVCRRAGDAGAAAAGPHRL